MGSAFSVAGMPLGIDAERVYANGVVRFEAGELLVFCTDGITEAPPARG
jgi:serine phosphatase RsbU (regulator of sigma subunit)